jgi:tetratricopeptide (TPR) repeat protein
MSARAPKSIFRPCGLALYCCCLLSGAQTIQAQAVAVSSAQVVETVRRLKLGQLGETQSALALGQVLLSEARYPEAYELFAALLEQLPREGVALYGASLAAFNLGRAAEAEPLARHAVEIYLAPVNANLSASVSPEQRRRGADALVLLAVILGARGADNEALKVSERAVALAPENFDAQFTLGRARYTVGDSAAAVLAFRAALALLPGDARTRFFLATALEGADKLDEALSVYRELVVSQPRVANGHLGLGSLLLKRGGAETEKGIAELQTAISLDPNLYEAQVGLGRALLSQKRAEESLAPLRRAAELAPTNPEPHYQLALAYRRLGLTEKAAAETAIVKRIHETRRGEAAPNGPEIRPKQQ